MLGKPTGRSEEAAWLEVHEAALLLEAARLHKPGRSDEAVPLYEMVATFLLTGGRTNEILGLEVGDVNFERRTITVRPNTWRRIKNDGSRRSIPLWPQLEEILRDYLRRTGRIGGLLFPSTHRRVRGERMITDVRRPLDQVAERCGWKEGEIRTKAFRHTYCAARLQTTDRGAPVSQFTVGRELGHGGDALVKRVYGHVGDLRWRGEEVEYRTDSAAQAIRDSTAREAYRAKVLALRGA